MTENAQTGFEGLFLLPIAGCVQYIFGIQEKGEVYESIPTCNQ